MTRVVAEKNGLRLVLVSNYGAAGYRILDKNGVCVLGYAYQGSEKSALKIFERKTK